MYEFLCDVVGCRNILHVRADQAYRARLRARAYGWRVVSGVKPEVKCEQHSPFTACPVEL